MATIGIDIGTSYSSVCVLDQNNQPERVKVATGTSIFGDAHSLPSAVFVETDGRLLLGQSAMANRLRIPENFKNEFKRDLGQIAPYLLGDRQFLPEDLYKEFFIYLKNCTEAYTHESVSEVTITCPAVFNKKKKELIESAAKRAGLLNITLLDEPTAAAFCYLNALKLREGDTLLVYDLGGGTFDVALMRYHGGTFEQLTQPQGDANCGGADFDKLIYNHIMEQIGEERLAPVRANASFYRKFSTQIMETAIKAKHHLSNADVFNDVIPVGYDGVDYMLTKNEYNTMIAPIVEETLHQVRTILNNAQLQASEICTVLLVGGASRTPLVRDMLTKLMGKEPLADIDPELAICAGAAVRSKVLAKFEDERRRQEEERKRQDEQRKRQENEQIQRLAREEAERIRLDLEAQQRAFEQQRLAAEKNKLEEQRRLRELWQQEEEQRLKAERQALEERRRLEAPLLECSARIQPPGGKYMKKGTLTIQRDVLEVESKGWIKAWDETINLREIVKVRQAASLNGIAATLTAAIIYSLWVVLAYFDVIEIDNGDLIFGIVAALSWLCYFIVLANRTHVKVQYGDNKMRVAFKKKDQAKRFRKVLVEAVQAAGKSGQSAA